MLDSIIQNTNQDYSYKVPGIRIRKDNMQSLELLKKQFTSDIMTALNLKNEK